MKNVASNGGSEGGTSAVIGTMSRGRAARGEARGQTNETRNRGFCRRALTRTGRWVRPFLKALAGSGNVKAGCAAARVSRATVYRHRAADPDFARLWVYALEDWADLLHAELFRRAVEGVERPVRHRGKIVGWVRECSDPLLLYLLRAARPEKFDEAAPGPADASTAGASREELALALEHERLSG